MNIDSRKVVLEHSKAKVELYQYYLAIYLNILQRSAWINTIYLIDMFAGEGVYEDGEKGSALMTLQCIKNHYFSNNKSCKNIQVYFNDSEYSEIEKDVLKIDRIKRESQSIYKPDKVQINYSQHTYSQMVAQTKPIIET